MDRSNKNAIEKPPAQEPVSRTDDPIRTRGRKRMSPSNREGFGYLLEACLEHSYRSEIEKGDAPGTFTAFLDSIANSADITPRHLSRIRASAQIPDSRVLEKLAVRVPLLKSVIDLAYTMRLSWESIVGDQEMLSQGSTITIISGFEPPRALNSDAIADQLAINLFEKDMKYIFLYPNTPPTNLIRLIDESLDKDFIRGWIDKLRDLVFRKGYERYGANWTDEEVAPMRIKARESIYLFHTIDKRPESTLFWSFSPRYLVLVNLFAPEGSEYERKQYGTFWDRGQLPPTITPFLVKDTTEPLDVHGWTYISPRDYDIYCNILRECQFKDEANRVFDYKGIPSPSPPNAKQNPLQGNSKTRN